MSPQSEPPFPVRRFVRRVLPRNSREFLRGVQRRLTLRWAIRRFARLGPEEAVPENLNADLVYGWGNEGYSARGEFLTGLIEHAWKADGPALECGSGLSTLLLALVLRRRSLSVWSLEHSYEWGERVRGELHSMGLTNSTVCVSGLRDYGDFTWYDAPLDQMPSDFALVVCDGPPGDTPGGRYGLIPCMRDRLRAGCVVLLDDVSRPGEMAVLRRWAEECNALSTVCGVDKPYGTLTLP